MPAHLPIRNPCPPGVCDCQLDILQQPGADTRILLLTRPEERRLFERLESLQSLEDLERMQQRLFEQLGICMHVKPAYGEVRSMQGILIQFDELPGLCRKTRQNIAAAVRRGLKNRPEIAYRLLDAHDLFGQL